MRDSVIVVGSGMMGSGIGAMAALAGQKTVLVDVQEARAASGLQRAIECMRLREENGLSSHEQVERALGLLSISTDLGEAAGSARLVVEAITENLEAKQELFALLDEMLPPDVPICSNTSGLQITRIAALCKHPERTLTTHFWLPAHLVPLVEVVMGDQSDEGMANQVISELKAWKKAPILVRRDLSGQLANRIFQAIIREAVSIVASGLASAEDVDTAISCGMGMRFPEWGPLMHLDAIGLNLGLSVQDTVLPSISAEKTANEFLRGMVERGELGVSTGKGFYDWKTRNIAVDMGKRDAFIIAAVKAKSMLDDN